jgi:hypothetical protein
MSVSIKPVCELQRLGLSRIDEETMRVCVALSSDIWTGYVDGEVVCVWGIAPPSLISDRAYLWLYTTDHIKEHQFIFVRHSQVEVKKMLEIYETIHGHVIIGQHDNMRWLKWLGATFGEPDDKKIPFQIRRKHG